MADISLNTRILQYQQAHNVSEEEAKKAVEQELEQENQEENCTERKKKFHSFQMEGISFEISVILLNLVNGLLVYISGQILASCAPVDKSC